MPSSDSPASEREEGAPDWSKEPRSDDLLSDEARRRIRQVLRELAEIEAARP